MAVQSVRAMGTTCLSSRALVCRGRCDPSHRCIRPSWTCRVHIRTTVLGLRPVLVQLRGKVICSHGTQQFSRDQIRFEFRLLTCGILRPSTPINNEQTRFQYERPALCSLILHSFQVVLLVPMLSICAPLLIICMSYTAVRSMKISGLSDAFFMVFQF